MTTSETPLRALLVARLSVLTDESTSPHRQLEHCRNVVQARSWTEAGTATDLDVSATKYSPFDRPELGGWLNDRNHEFDVIVVWRLDRLVRSSKDLSDLLAWCETNGKSLVSASEGFDLGTPFGKAMVTIIAALGELEANTLSTRVKDSHTALQKMDRWSGGQPPYGYRIVEHERAGKTLEIDPVTSAAVRRMGEMTIAGKSQWEIASTLNEEGFPTPAQHTGAKNASEHWNQSSIGKILRAPTTQGFKTLGTGKDRRLARGADGMAIRYVANGIFTDEEWNKIQASLKQRSRSRERSHGAAPLLGIVFCQGCGNRLYRARTTHRGKGYGYYRCVPKAGKPRCEGYSFSEEHVQAVLDELAAEELKGIPIVKKVFVPGEDHTDELNAVKKAMTSIRDEHDLGFYDYEGGDNDYRERLSSLVEKRKKLEAMPQRESTYEEQPTGETYAEAYERMSTEERRDLLLKAGIEARFAPYESHLYVPMELRERLTNKS